jgi:hypothetical protein
MNEGEEHLAIIPLHFFDSDVELLRLNERVCIRTIGSEELKALIERTRKNYGVTLELELFDTKYVIEITSKNVATPLEKTVLALRLLKAGDFKVPTVFTKRLGITHRSGVFHRTNYFLKKEEKESFIALWRKVQEYSGKPHLHYSIHSFMNAYDRIDTTDKIVDLVVALESLAFYGEEKTIEPAGKVIGIAIACMLGTSQKERDKIRKALTDAYEIRNARVHGNMKKLMKWTSDAMERLSNDIEDYLRRTLRKLVEE